MSNSIKVMIADDHVLIRQGIKQLLETDRTMQVIDEAGNGNECLEKLKYVKPDILLLDIDMPNKNGFEVLKEIRSRRETVKTLIISAHNESKYIINALNNGANGYLVKDTDISELRKAIHIVINGNKYIPSNLIKILNFELENKHMELQKKINENFLTKREQEVLLKVATGMSNKEIATNLNITEPTVKNHVSNIFKKIRVSDRTQAAIYAIKNLV